MHKTLQDIFNDDELGLLDIPPQTTISPKTEEDRLLESFHELNDFYAKNHREPSPDSMAEYGLLSKLNFIKSNQEYKILCKPYDTHNLLGEVEIEPKSLVDELEDELGLLDLDMDLSIYDFKHTPKIDKRAKTDYVAQRQPLSEKEFAKYEPMFIQVHRELKEGKRHLLPFKDAEKNLIEGNFYVLDGLLVYLEVSNAQKVLKENKSGNRVRLEGRTVTIFENGTISNMLFRSLGKALHKNGKIVSNTYENTEKSLLKSAGLLNEKDQKSGWIYILKSKSKNPEIASIKNLYKIGFSTTKVAERIKNASKEATYLFSDVEVVATYSCYNLNVHHFETLLHRFFGKHCLDIDIYNEKQQRITPREWFVVPLNIINEAIQLIISGNIIHYEYDFENQKLVLKQ